MIDPVFFVINLSLMARIFLPVCRIRFLKVFAAGVTGHSGKKNHMIAVNEGTAVALACGYHLARSAGYSVKTLVELRRLLSEISADKNKRYGPLSYPVMMNTAKIILEKERSLKADDLCMPIKDILELIPGGK